jgi:hypothetical protein
MKIITPLGYVDGRATPSVLRLGLGIPAALINRIGAPLATPRLRLPLSLFYRFIRTNVRQNRWDRVANSGMNSRPPVAL